MLAPLGELAAPGPLLDTCRASRDLWGPWVAALESETGLSVDYDTSGALLVALDEEEEAETATLGRTFILDANTANAFSKLSRYETGIEGRFYKAWHELQRLQAARRAEGNVSPPLAIDVDVSGVSGEEF